MTWKTILSASFLILSIGLSSKLMFNSYAFTGPSISLGTNPLTSEFLSASVTESTYSSYSTTNTSLFTVSANNMDFVVTGIAHDASTTDTCKNTSCMYLLKVDGTEIPTNIFEQNFDPKLVLKSGSLLEVQARTTCQSGNYGACFTPCTVTCRYYLQGYYVAE